MYGDIASKIYGDIASEIYGDITSKIYGDQGRSQTQNLGGGHFFWKNKITEVDFLQFYGN